MDSDGDLGDQVAGVGGRMSVEDRIASETQISPQPPSAGWGLPLPCSLSDILTMSCKSRAEAFARKLSTRLKSLGSSQDGDQEHLVDGDGLEGATAPMDTCHDGESGDVISESPRQSAVFVHNPRVVTVGINSTTGNLLFVKQRGDGEVARDYNTVGLNGISTLDLTPPRDPVDSDVYYDFDIASPEFSLEQESTEYAINNADDLTLSPDENCSSPTDENLPCSNSLPPATAASTIGTSSEDNATQNVAKVNLVGKCSDDSETSESVYFDADSSVDLSDVPNFPVDGNSLRPNFPVDGNSLRPAPIAEASSRSDSDEGDSSRATPTNQDEATAKEEDEASTPEPAEGEESAYGSRSSSTAQDLIADEQALILTAAEEAIDYELSKLTFCEEDSTEAQCEEVMILNTQETEQTHTEEPENKDICSPSNVPDLTFSIPDIEEPLVNDYYVPVTPQSSPTSQERCLCYSPDSSPNSDTGLNEPPVEPPCPSPLLAADHKEHHEDCLCGGKVPEPHVSRRAQHEKQSTIDDDERVKLRRSSSLKSGKTPPGTPGRKKIVRFADCLGLDLADVRTFLDEIPNIPKSAYSDLDDDDLMNPNHNPRAHPMFSSSDPSSPMEMRSSNNFKAIVPMFQQPGGFPTFLDRIKEQKVSLENVMVCEDLSMKGTARVLNMDFHKSVFLRYTLDNWHTWRDLHASYVNGSCDGLSDQFQFTLYATSCLEVGQRILFALCYQTLGQQFWDNNNGDDYCIQCFSH